MSSCPLSDPGRCKVAVGVEDKRISSGSLSASSSYNSNHGPQCARLNQPAGRGRVGAWCAKYNNRNQWLQVGFASLATVTGVSTQGRQDAHQWVTSYAVSYSRDGKRFVPYRQHGRTRVCHDNWICFSTKGSLICFALLCFALLCFALLCFVLFCKESWLSSQTNLQYPQGNIAMEFSAEVVILHSIPFF